MCIRDRLERYRVPTFLFVNKLDLPGADRGALLAEVQARLDGGCADLGADRPRGALEESVALCSEELMERYLEAGALEDGEIAEAVAKRRVFPCFFGSALRLSLIHISCAGISTKLLSDIECGRANPTFETMDLVAAALGVELEELLQPEQVIDLLPKNDLARYQQMLDRLPPFAQEMVIAGLEGAISQCLQVSKEW